MDLTNEQNQPAMKIPTIQVLGTDVGEGVTDFSFAIDGRPLHQAQNIMGEGDDGTACIELLQALCKKGLFFLVDSEGNEIA